MDKILYCASMASHIDNFHQPYIAEYKRRGYGVDVCTTGKPLCADVDKCFDIPFVKKIYSPRNILTVLKLAHIIRREKYAAIMTQASLAGIIGRAAAILSFTKVKTIHICHGYLFNDDGGRRAKLMLFCEKLLRKSTDILVVMNKDDLKIAEKYKLGKNIRFINGMGLNEGQLIPVSHEDSLILRDGLGLNRSDVVFVSIGEFSGRKNQQLILHAFAKMKNKDKCVVMLAGDGELLNSCQQLSKELGIWERVIFVHHSGNVNGLLRMSDCFVTSSKFEGLPFCVMEALYCGLPVIASAVKGHTDLVNERNGFLFSSENSLAEIMDIMAEDKELRLAKSNAGLDGHFLLKNIFEENMEQFGI